MHAGRDHSIVITVATKLGIPQNCLLGEKDTCEDGVATFFFFKMFLFTILISFPICRACTLDKACLEIRDARRAVSALGEEIDYLELAVLKKYSSLAKAESEFKHFKKNPRLQDDIARDTEAIDGNKRICDNEMDMLNKLELKRSSLQAAVNYTPKIDLFIEYYDFEGF